MYIKIALKNWGELSKFSLLILLFRVNGNESLMRN